MVSGLHSSVCETSVPAPGGMVQEGQFAGTTNQPFVRCNAEPSHADLRDDGSGVGYAAVFIDSASACLAPRGRRVTGRDWPVCAGGLPYTWKFLWAPLMDRIRLPLGRRRGWMLAAQIGLVCAIGALGYIDPLNQTALVAVFASVIAFLSATQDVAIDAYRREILPDEELGLGNAIHVRPIASRAWCRDRCL